MAAAERLCVLGDAERALLAGDRRPIVLLPRREDSAIAASVAPGNARLGLMLPYTPLHRLLFDESLDALVMTSGNMSEEPIVSRNEDAWPRLASLADAFLLHNRDIRTRVDDSVFQIFDGREYPVRRSRGYAPDPIALAMPLAEVLACGGELKNTLCLTKDKYAILSQHIGDLENLETMEFFRETLDPSAALLPRDARGGSARSASELPRHAFCAGGIGPASHRRATPSCAHRELHGGQRHRWRRYRRGARWHGLRHGRQDLGRRIPGLRFSPFRAPRPSDATFPWPAETVRSGSRGGARWRTCAMHSATARFRCRCRCSARSPRSTCARWIQ